MYRSLPKSRLRLAFECSPGQYQYILLQVTFFQTNSSKGQKNRQTFASNQRENHGKASSSESCRAADLTDDENRMVILIQRIGVGHVVLQNKTTDPEKSVVGEPRHFQIVIIRSKQSVKLV